MSHFNRKSLIFYSVAIGSVVVLFELVTSYGEANLKAPSAIGGDYRLQAENLPPCLQAEPLTLLVQQSGVYLNGTLFTEKNEKIAKERPSLSGKWQAPNLTLSGSIPQPESCQSENNENTVSLQASWEKDQLKGQIQLAPTQEAINFVAQKEEPETTSKQKH